MHVGTSSVDWNSQDCSMKVLLFSFLSTNILTVSLLLIAATANYPFESIAESISNTFEWVALIFVDYA
jgi:hypothetical protein